MQPTQHDHSNINMKALIYGTPGTGKTTLAGSAQGLGPVAFIDVEGGMLSVPASKDVWVFNVRNTPGGSTCMDQLEQILWTISANNVKENPWLKGLRTVVLDSGSEFLNLALEAIVDQEIKKNSKRHDVSDVWLADYGKATSRLTRIFRHLRDLPLNVIVTALVKTVMPPHAEGSNINTQINVEPLEVRPAFTAKLGESVMGFYDNVWYAYTTDTKGERFNLLTRPRGPYRAKTRGHKFSEAIGERVVNPDFTKLYQILVEAEGTPAKK